MSDRGTVSAELVRLMVRYAEGRGIDTAPALRTLRLAELGDGDRADGARVAALLSQLAGLAGDPLFGIRLGAWARSQPIHHLVLATALSSRTAGEALERLLRYHALLADTLAPSLVRDGATAELRVAAEREAGADGQLTEAAVTMLAGLVRRVAGELGSLEVRLRRPAAAPAAEYESTLHATVRFGAPVDAVRFPASNLATPLAFADAELAELLDRHATSRLTELRRATWTARTARAVRAALVKTGRVPALGEISRSLAAAPRSLQERLREERTGFRKVCDEVRRERGDELLRDRTVSLVEIAFLLGFADQSAFTHAFRRWSGLTPAAYRRSISPVRR